MEQENKEVEEEVVVEEETQNETESETEAPVQEPEEKKEDVDYKSEFEKVSKRLGQAEHKLDSQRVELKESKKESTVDVDKIREEILAETKKGIEEFKQDLTKDNYETLLSSITNDADERKLIDFYYENRINKSGFSRQDIANDLSDARILANKKRFEKTMGEMEQTMISKNTKKSQSSPASDGGGSDGAEEIKLSAKELRMASAYGLTPEEVKNGINRN